MDTKDIVLLVWSGIIGILSSLAASALFLYFLSRIRPEMEISPEIAKITEPGGRIKYSVKVINRTDKHVINVRAVMTVRTPHNVHGGTIFINTYITLKTAEVLEIKRFNPTDTNADYAVRFVTFDDLDHIWVHNPMSVVEFHLYATHSLTGFGRVFTRQYHDKDNELKVGNFKYGNNLDIA